MISTVANGGTLVLSRGGVSGRGRFVGPLGLLIRAQIYSRVTRLRIRTGKVIIAMRP